MKSFVRLWKMECRKAFINRFFGITLCGGIIFCIMSALYNIESYFQGQYQLRQLGGNPMTQAFGLFNHWIGGEQSSLGYILFFSVFPLLSITFHISLWLVTMFRKKIRIYKNGCDQRGKRKVLFG